MLFALSTSHEIGLAVMGAIFITFALLSSFVFPRFSPDFPTKKGLRWYLPLAFGFFIAMMASVIVFGREAKAEAVNTGTTTTGTTTTSTTSKYAGGDPAAGKTEFTNAGCSACHTFKPAGSTGTIGPNLDDLPVYAQKAGEPLQDFIGGAIVHPPPAYVPPGFANSMPTNFGTTLTPAQIKDLVAFLTQPSGG